jgi:hypothetical protein
MTKLLLWIFIVGVALLALRLVNVANAKRRNDARGNAPPRGVLGDDMVRCVRCGVYLPTADAKSGPEGLTCGEPGCLERR